MDCTSREDREERDFSDDVSEELSEIGHGFSNECVILCTLYARRLSVCSSQMSHDQPYCRGS